jgi:hypothetical protein
MNTLNKTRLVLFAAILCLSIFVAATRPAQGGVSREETEFPYKVYQPLIAHNFNAVPPLFGVQMYGSTRPTNPYTPFLLQSNASWVRVPVSWNSAEPVNTTPGNYSWAAIDAALAVAVHQSPRVIATVDIAPEWAADAPTSPIYPARLPDFAEFVKAVVERYDGDGYQDAPGNPVVNYWEFYNEPDAKLTNWVPGWGNNGAQYAEMLQTVYPAVKQANPRAQVVFGGIAYDWWESASGPFVESFLDDVLQAGAGPFFDIMNFHAYPSFATNWTNDGSSGLYEKAQAVRNKLLNYQLDKPLIITEAGWHSSNELTAPSSPELQARFVTELFVESMAADLDVMIWWMLFDPGGGGYANGLITSAPNPATKPSFTAYTTLVSQLGGTQFVRMLATPPPVFNPDGSVHSMDAYEFRDATNKRTIYVAWMNPVNGTVVWQLRLPGQQATVRSIYGNVTLNLTDAGDGVVDGQITVPVGSQPVYVEVPW